MWHQCNTENTHACAILGVCLPFDTHNSLSTEYTKFPLLPGRACQNPPFMFVPYIHPVSFMLPLNQVICYNKACHHVSEFWLLEISIRVPCRQMTCSGLKRKTRNLDNGDRNDHQVICPFDMQFGIYIIWRTKIVQRYHKHVSASLPQCKMHHYI